MQIFVDCLLEQCDRHKLNAELVLVEWNPPSDRKPLAEELKWKRGEGCCDIRIITVPPEIHRRYKSSENLPLFQMIAKNVGIRRARGEYILCTNIDIIFSDELMSFLAQGNLKSKHFYRSLRTDVSEDIPSSLTVAAALDFCRTSTVRLNLPGHTLEYPKVGFVQNLIRSSDISITPDKKQLAEICFGGHLPVLFLGEQTEFRFDKQVENQSKTARVMVLDLIPNPISHKGSLRVVFKDKQGVTVYESLIRNREKLAIVISYDIDSVLMTCVSSVSNEDNSGHRLAPACLVSVGWINDMPFSSGDFDCYVVGNSVSVLGQVGPPEISKEGRRGVSRKVGGPAYLQLSPRSKPQKLIFSMLNSQGRSLRHPPKLLFNGTNQQCPVRFVTGHWIGDLPPCDHQHFVTIASQCDKNWHLTDVHLTRSVLTECAKVVARSVYRCFWRVAKPHGANIFDVISPNFELSFIDAPLRVVSGLPIRGMGRRCSLRVRNSTKRAQTLIVDLIPSRPLGGEIAGLTARLDGKSVEASVHKGGTRLEISLPPLTKGSKLEFELEGRADEVDHLHRGPLELLNHHALLTKLYWKDALSVDPPPPRARADCWHILPDPSDVPIARNPLDLRGSNLPDLFSNACGDFTLAHKSAWDRVHGYAELDVFSMHLDSLLLYALHYADFEEVRLPQGMTHYHIEHDSGWSPEKNKQMYLRLHERGIPWLGFYHDITLLALVMRRYNHPIVFNGPDWGLILENLPEVSI